MQHEELALFETDGAEATGRVFHFCCSGCRENFRQINGSMPLAAGTSSPIAFSQCDTCGAEFTPPPAPEPAPPREPGYYKRYDERRDRWCVDKVDEDGDLVEDVASAQTETTADRIVAALGGQEAYAVKAGDRLVPWSTHVSPNECDRAYRAVLELGIAYAEDRGPYVVKRVLLAELPNEEV